MVPRAGRAGSSTPPSDEPGGEPPRSANASLQGTPAVVRDDGTGSLSFNWGEGTPNATCGIPSDNFSATFSRSVTFAAGSYQFSATADDGVRVWVDGAQVINGWWDHAAQTFTSSGVALTAGAHTVVVDFYERSGGAQLAVSWGPYTPPPPPPPSPPTMYQDSAVRGCSNYSEHMDYMGSAADCASYCANNGANACEWDEGAGECWRAYGSGCTWKAGTPAGGRGS